MDNQRRSKMRSFITLTITMLLILPLILVIPLPVIAQPQEALSDAVDGGTGGTFHLDPSILYTGGVTITGDTRIYGQGAMIDLQEESIKVTGAYLYIERCYIANGTDGDGEPSGAIEFYDDASGFVYNNVIMDSEYHGISIGYQDNGPRGCSDITIKENSILYSFLAGIYFEDSTDITILENTIKHNTFGINGDNYHLMDTDDDSYYDDFSLHNIMIKGNTIISSDQDNIDLTNVNGVSISSNLISSSWDDIGIILRYCPIVSITHNKIYANDDHGIRFRGNEDWPIVDTDGDGTDETTVELSLTISYNKIMGNHKHGIDIEDMNNIVITYNEISWNRRDGIRIEGDLDNEDGGILGEDIVIAYNIIKENGEEDENKNDDGIYLYDVGKVKIIFNRVSGNSDDGMYIEGITPDYSEDLLVKGNVIEGNKGYGMQIYLFGDPVVVEWNTVFGNRIDDSQIWVEYCVNPQINYNTVMYGFWGIAVDRCHDGGRIAYNTLAYNYRDGIDVMSSEDIIVEYNTVIGNNFDGIWISESSDITVQSNVVHNNYEDGIEYEYSSGLISNNMVGHSDGGTPPTSISGQWSGIAIWVCISDDDDTVTISDNTIIGNYDGISCYYSDPTIIRNYIANNVYGIELDDCDLTIGGSPSNRNYIIRNLADGVWIDSDSSPVITYNNIYGNVNYGVYNAGADIDDATNNWWGSIDGPSGAGPGSGDEVTSGIEYAVWLTANIP